MADRATVIDGLVSTVIPVFNRADLLREAVASVLAQDYRPIEIVIVDDGSTDDTGRVADDLAATHPDLIRSLHTANRGPGAAREAGRRRLRGEFVQYLDSDDLLLPGKFTSQVAGLGANPDCNASYGMTRFRHADGRIEPTPWKRTGEAIATMFPSFLQSRWWSTPNPLFRRSICDQAGAWLATRVEEDWEYDCRIASMGGRLHYLPDYVCEVRDHQSPRQSRGEPRDPGRMSDRALAHRMIYQSAKTAGIDAETPEMQHFARELFLLARQCGAAGLPQEARALFQLARTASDLRRSNGLDFRLYGLIAGVIGWEKAGKLAGLFDQSRKILTERQY